MPDYQPVRRMAVTENFAVRMLYRTVPTKRKLPGRKYRTRKIGVDLVYDTCHIKTQN
jgi:hypothetical protein